jgi:hypothetical protein
MEREKWAGYIKARAPRPQAAPPAPRCSDVALTFCCCLSRSTTAAR